MGNVCMANTDTVRIRNSAREALATVITQPGNGPGDNIIRFEPNFNSIPATVALADVWSSAHSKTITSYQRIADAFAEWSTNVYYSPVFN